MKYFTVFVLILILASCKTNNKPVSILTTDSLFVQQFSVYTDRDTTLKTNNGAIIEIPKGSIVVKDGNVAVLDIKEAYAFAAIIRAGLTTLSDGEPLSSGGMIYINAAAGQKLTITKPIRVAIPTEYLTNGMQLFKGDTSGGTINWKDPKPISENKQLAAINEGKIIFEQSCASCHSIGRDVVGPDLAHFEKRFPYSESSVKYWTHNFSTSSNVSDSSLDQLYYGPDLYACKLKAMYGSLAAPPFPQLKYKVWKAIYDYVQTRSDSLNLPLPSHAWLKSCTDSCELYSAVINSLQNQKQDALNRKGSLLKNNRTDTLGVVPNFNALPVNGYDEMVSPNYYSPQYYQFTIDSFGWFNIDILMKNLPGTEPSNLMVRIQGEFHERVTINLIIPAIKLNAVGGATKTKDEYAFFSSDGSIPLPQNTEAYILAYSESEDKIAFQLERFITGKQQTLSVALKESTKQEFNAALKIFEKEGLKIKVVDTKNAPELRSIDTSIQSINQKIKDAGRLKPKVCDCNCGDSKPTGRLVRQNDYLDTSKK
jgi:hypothetical protein